MSRKKSSVNIKMRYFSVFIIVFCLASCELFHSTENLHLYVPAILPEILNEAEYSWELTYLDSKGNEQFIHAPGGTDFFSIDVEKGIVQPFCLRAIITFPNLGEVKTLPAGFIYTISKKTGGKDYFEWKRGFESYLLICLMKHLNVGKINVSRLVSSISEVAEEDSHWLIDGELITENLLSGNFRVYDIRKKRERDISLLIPAGIWFNSDTTGENIISIGDSESVELTVSTGYSSYFCHSGSVLEVDMKSDGDFDYLIY
jgi:hypothetical protein